jgi:hypothetical protein
MFGVDEGARRTQGITLRGHASYAGRGCGQDAVAPVGRFVISKLNRCCDLAACRERGWVPNLEFHGLSDMKNEVVGS